MPTSTTPAASPCSLTPDARDTFKKYHDVLEEQRQLELEAMFLSAFALCRELG